jgi:hypothetical protein
MACLRNEKTTTILIKQVVITSRAGKNDRRVRKRRTSRGLVSPKILPVGAAAGAASALMGINNIQVSRSTRAL